MVVTADKRIPKIRIETRQAADLMGQRIVVAIDNWPSTSRYPQVGLAHLMKFPAHVVSIICSYGHEPCSHF